MVDKYSPTSARYIRRQGVRSTAVVTYSPTYVRPFFRDPRGGTNFKRDKHHRREVSRRAWSGAPSNTGENPGRLIISVPQSTKTDCVACAPKVTRQQDLRPDATTEKAKNCRNYCVVSSLAGRAAAASQPSTSPPRHRGIPHQAKTTARQHSSSAAWSALCASNLAVLYSTPQHRHCAGPQKTQLYKNQQNLRATDERFSTGRPDQTTPVGSRSKGTKTRRKKKKRTTKKKKSTSETKTKTNTTRAFLSQKIWHRNINIKQSNNNPTQQYYHAIRLHLL